MNELEEEAQACLVGNWFRWLGGVSELGCETLMRGFIFKQDGWMGGSSVFFACCLS